MRIIAVVTRRDMFLPGVRDVKHSSTPPAAKNTGEQCAAATTGSGVSIRLHVSIGSQHGLIAFILLPVNVPGMVVRNQDGPRRSRFQMPLALSGPTIHDLDAYFSSAEDVGPCVDRIGENRPD